MASFIPSSILTLVGAQQPHFLDLSTDALPKTINQQPSASFSSTSTLFSLASSSVRQEETRPLLPHRGLASHIISRSAVGLDLTRSLSASSSPPYPHSCTPSSSASALVTTQPEGIRILGQPSKCPVTLASTWFYSPPVYSSTGYCPYRYREIMVLLEGMYIYPDGDRFKTPVWVKDGMVVHVVQREFSHRWAICIDRKHIAETHSRNLEVIKESDKAKIARWEREIDELRAEEEERKVDVLPMFRRGMGKMREMSRAWLCFSW